MERLLYTFDAPFTNRDGDIYDIEVYGRVRPGDTWQAWLTFTRRRDGERLSTDIETTQPTDAAVVYWAGGLSTTYFDGALERTRKHVLPHPAETSVDSLPSLDRAILRCFIRHATTQLSTEMLFADLPDARADVVRALADLQNRRRLVLRRTEAGNDWVYLTDQGVRAITIASDTSRESSPPPPST